MLRYKNRTYNLNDLNDFANLVSVASINDLRQLGLMKRRYLKHLVWSAVRLDKYRLMRHLLDITRDNDVSYYFVVNYGLEKAGEFNERRIERLLYYAMDHRYPDMDIPDMR